MMATSVEDRQIVYSSRTEAPGYTRAGRRSPARPPAAGIWRVLARSPGLVPAAGTLPVVLYMVTREGGYHTTTWYAVGLWLALLLAVLLVAMPAPRRPPLPVLAAIGALTAYALWSYLSIGWAEQKGIALEGANRTAFYAIVLALLSLWTLRGREAAWVVGLFATGVAVVAAAQLLRASSAADPLDWFLGGRFTRPVGYVNGSAALWAMASWPCVVLAARREVLPPLRALLTAAAVLLAGLAVLGQSRGWLYSMPIVAVGYLVFARERVRALLWVVLAFGAAAATAPRAFDLYDAVSGGADPGPALDRSTQAIFLAAGLAGLVALVVALADSRVRVPRAAAVAGERALRFAVAFVLILALALAVAGVGNVGGRLDDAWHSFKRGGDPSAAHTRFGTSLGSNRYDFWRVGLQQFGDRPLAGIGADNFQQVYARERRSPEEPLYPHSLGVRVLSQTGIVGAALVLALLAGALVAVAAGVRARRGAGSAAALAAATSFGYWLVHGQVDWLWEFAGLGGAAFAMLGVALALRPRPPAAPGWRGAPLLRTPAAAAVAGAVALGVCVLFGAPWLSVRYADRAAGEWVVNRNGAFRDLDRAASLNPVSAQSKLLAGAIALRLGDLATARRSFSAALEREGGDPYPLLELGMLEARAGNKRRAVALLDRSVRANPGDDLTRSVRARVRRNVPVSIARVNRQILARAQVRTKSR